MFLPLGNIPTNNFDDFFFTNLKFESVWYSYGFPVAQQTNSEVQQPLSISNPSHRIFRCSESKSKTTSIASIFHLSTQGQTRIVLACDSKYTVFLVKN